MGTIGLVIITMLAFSAFFSGMEIAFVSSSRLKQELDLKRKELSAQILSVFYRNPSRFIGALLLGNNIALVIYGIAMAILLEPAIKNVLPPEWISEFSVLIIQTVISTLIILITAEFLPKVLFRINPNQTLKFFAIPVWLFYFVFYPIILLYIGVSEFILRKLLRVRLSSTHYQFSPVDLEVYVKDYQPSSENQATVDREIQMIQNVIEFKYVKLRDCMVPRTEIKAVGWEENIETLRNLFTETGHSKIMIYKNSIDNLIGFVHSYDMFSNPTDIKSLIHKVDVYPGSMAANELLDIFTRKHRNIAIVVDEFGGTSGIVTMEDIIEEIFGEIEDEYDREDLVEEQVSDNQYILSTRLEIDYLNEKYRFDIPESDEYSTLAGYIIQHHESIPPVGEKIVIPPFTFTVLKSTHNRIDQVRLTY